MGEKRAFIKLDRDGWTKGLQLSIDLEDDKGGGVGYRLAGPKFNGSSTSVFTHCLSERDANEIRSYLDAAFPKQKRDFTDAKEITLAIDKTDNPIASAVTVIGLAAGVLEMRSGVDAAVRFLHAAADAITENAAALSRHGEGNG